MCFLVGGTAPQNTKLTPILKTDQKHSRLNAIGLRDADLFFLLKWFNEAIRLFALKQLAFAKSGQLS